MSTVEFIGVRKRFGEYQALKGLDLKVESGEFVSLLGPSGSGKSTTLNVLAGLVRPDAGSVLIDGQPVTHLTPDKRDIAMVFQNYALYPHLTVAENLAFPLEARRPRPQPADIEQRIGRVADKLGIAQLLHRYPKEISGGQQQRVALGRAMIRDPKVFLLDEPLSNLDARLRIRMRQDIKALHESIGSTIVYVTHDQSEAVTLSSRIAVFDQGELQQYSTPQHLYARPANRFVANFVGEREVAFLEGVVHRHAGGLEFRCGEVRFAIRPAESLADGRPVTLGLRPEALELAPEGEGTPARFAFSELAGPDTYLYAVLPGGGEVGLRTHAPVHLRKGDTVWLRTLPERTLVFDTGSQRAID